MSKVYTHYVTWNSRKVRMHGSSWVDIVQPSISEMSPGDRFQVPWAPPSITWTDNTNKNQSAVFAFWSIKGGIEGALASTKNAPPSVGVGNENIVAIAWYISGGGIGHNVLIDAFDVSLGIFVDDPFVTVEPDKDLTADANDYGVVPTASQENIVAYPTIHSVPFSRWEVISGNDKKDENLKIKDENLNVKAQSAGIAFAFYQIPSTSVAIEGPIQDQQVAGTWVSWGVMVDGGGPTGVGPVSPWNPHMKDLAAGLALADAANKINPSLRADVLSIASKQVSIAAESMTKKIDKEMRDYEVAAKHSKLDKI